MLAQRPAIAHGFQVCFTIRSRQVFQRGGEDQPRLPWGGGGGGISIGGCVCVCVCFSDALAFKHHVIYVNHLGPEALLFYMRAMRQR